MKSSCMPCLGDLKQITLHPSLTAGIRINNKKTGETGSQSVTFSTGMDLRRALLMAGAALAAAHLFFFLCRMRRENMIRKKYRKKMEKIREKMKNS